MAASDKKQQSDIKSRLQQSRAFDQNLIQKRPAEEQQINEGTGPDKEDEMENRMAQLGATAQAAIRSDAGRASQFKAATSMLKQFHAMQAASPEEAKKTQEATKKLAKQMVPKAALLIVNSIASALELGTAGMAFLVTFFIRFITLGWYNTETIYGGFITKGKHFFIGPLTWDPIPMPLPKTEGTNALGPMILLIITDLVMIALILLPFVIIAFLITHHPVFILLK